MTATAENVTRRLLDLREESYAEFQRKLVPNVAPERIVGVRVPLIRKFASGLTDEENAEFTGQLPHYYMEENILHGVIVERIKDFDLALAETERFLPYVDNWAVCDTFSTVCPDSRAEELYRAAVRWTKSTHLYMARYGVVCLMRGFLGDRFRPEVLEVVCRVHGDYYLNMAAAWFFAEALIKRYDETLPYFTQGRLDADVRKKALRKAAESFRVSPERKVFLKSL